MGLLDDASELLGHQARLEAAEQASLETKYAGRSADWTKELAALLVERGIPLKPVYVTGPQSKPEQFPGGWLVTTTSTYWGEAWDLQGWKPDSEWGPRPVSILLQASGSFWHGEGQTVTLVDSDHGWRDDGHWKSEYPDVVPEHREKFLLCNLPPSSVGSLVSSLVSSFEDLREMVGVSVAAALQSDAVDPGARIVGVKPR
ncbi:hypothetical protein ACX80Z_11550 [Arthrobacter sp. TMT4-20]